MHGRKRAVMMKQIMTRRTVTMIRIWMGRRKGWKRKMRMGTKRKRRMERIWMRMMMRTGRRSKMERSVIARKMITGILSSKQDNL